MLNHVGQLDNHSLLGLVEIERIRRIVRILLLVQHLVQGINIGVGLGVLVLLLLHHVEDLGSFTDLFVLFRALSFGQGRPSLKIVFLRDLVQIEAVLANQLLPDIFGDVPVTVKAPASATLADGSFFVAQIAAMIGVIGSDRLLVDHMVDPVGVLMSARHDCKPAKRLLVALVCPDTRAHYKQHDEDDDADADDNDSHGVVVIDFRAHFLLRDHVLRLRNWDDW